MLCVLAVAIGLGAYALGFHKKFTPEPRQAPEVAFASIKGETIALNSLRGKVVLINFWATDCAVCVKEMPAIAATYEKFQARGFETIAVAMRHDPPNYVLAYAEKNRLPFKVVFDPIGAHAKAFGDVRLTPTSFLIDKRGAIVWQIQGEPDFGTLHALLEKKLSEKI